MVKLVGIQKKVEEDERKNPFLDELERKFLFESCFSPIGSVMTPEI